MKYALPLVLLTIAMLVGTTNESDGNHILSGKDLSHVRGSYIGAN